MTQQAGENNPTKDADTLVNQTGNKRATKGADLGSKVQVVSDADQKRMSLQKTMQAKMEAARLLAVAEQATALTGSVDRGQEIAEKAIHGTDAEKIAAEEVMNKGFFAWAKGKDISEERARLYGLSVKNASALVVEFSNWMDPNVIRNPDRVFIGPEHPYSYTWVDYQDREVPRMIRNSLLQQGYRMADLRKLVDYYVIGREALMLELPRKQHILSVLAKKGQPLPPQLPDPLRAAFGTVTPLVVDPETGRAVNGTRELWYIERDVRDAWHTEYLRKANQHDRLFQTGPGMQSESVREKTLEIGIDALIRQAAMKGY